MFLRRARRDEGGLALITVVVAATIMALFATTLVAYASSSQNISRHDQDWNAALAAAEAGIDDYVFRLNEDDLYYTYGPGTPTPDPPDGNSAFTTFTPVAGSSSTDSSYMYAVDRARLSTDGTLTIRSTGRVRDTDRTVSATLRRRSFLDYLYFTEYETRDPALYTGSGEFTSTQAATFCAKHYYGDFGNRRDVAGRTDYTGDTDGNTCTDINFASGDTIRGPLHTNDAFLVCGTPSFLGETTSAFQVSEGENRYRENGGCDGNDPTFARTGDPAYDSEIEMPPTTGELRQYVEPDTPTNQGGGCLYTGPTRIRFNADGTMSVKSPYSKQTNNACPVYGNGPIPSNGVIYVQNVPAASSDPNSWNGAGSCPQTQYTGIAPNKNWNTFGDNRQWSGPAHPLGYGNPGGSMSDDNDKDRNTSYQCRAGDAFVEGVLDGQVTIGVQNNIVVIDNVTYESGITGDPPDLLGLIAEQFVEVYHPVDCLDDRGSCEMRAIVPPRARFDRPPGSSPFTPGFTSNEPSSSYDDGVFDDPTINAAILSLKHSFRVQQYQYGDTDQLDELHVVGAIAQQYRGIVGLIGNTGYVKDYVYDNRLKYLSPPKFLDPLQVAWGVATWAEVDNPD